MVELPETVWVVFKTHGEWEGATIYAICGSDELAEKAKIRLAAELQNPIRSFEVAEVATNAVHLYGVLVQDGSFDIEKKA
jgi:hypothetical protein